MSITFACAVVHSALIYEGIVSSRAIGFYLPRLVTMHGKSRVFLPSINAGATSCHPSLVFMGEGNTGELELRKKAMGIDWMNNYELTQAIPPAYTHWIGEQLLISGWQ